MGGDYTRMTFDPRKDHSSVLMQQGRVQLDADWNEQAEILDRRLRLETTDVVGRTGVPAETPDGFAIAWDGSGLTIGAGRMYVDGLLVENHGPDGGATGYDAATGELVGTDPLAYDSQPYFPDASTVEPLPTDAGPHLVYLDVWQREVTAVQEPGLIEPAVGVDTATRLQTAWRVRVLTDVGANVTCSTPDSALAGWADATRPSGGRLSTAAVGVPTSDDPCTISPNGGYRGIENRLYRVEIHDPGAPGAATFTWSRDNASIETAVTDVDPSGKLLAVARTGRDALLRFAENDWVEITDDARELRGEPGELHQVAQVDGVGGTILLADALTVPFAAGRHTRVRRWDETAAPGVVTVPAAGTPYVLEDGVQITFDTDGSGAFATGDYWLFAARTADSSVELLDHAPPRGPHHHYARLAVATITDPATPPQDCRLPFKGLADLRECGCCTISVRPGDDLAARIGELPPAGGRVCFAAGDYQLRAPLTLSGLTGVELVGTGTGTTVRALANEAALVLQGCTDVEVSHIRFEGAVAADQHRNGALTLLDCTDVRVVDCSFSCPDAAVAGRGTQACLTARATTAAPAGDITVESSRFDVGAWQTGILLVDLAAVRVTGNRLSMPGADAQPTAPTLVRITSQLAALASAALHPAASAASVPLTVGAATLHVAQDSPLLDVFHAVAASPAAGTIKTSAEAVSLVTDTAAFHVAGPTLTAPTLATAALAAPRLELATDAHPAAVPAAAAPAVELSPALVASLGRTLTTVPLRSVGQGILVAGTALGSVELLDNVVEDALEGIKVVAWAKGRSSPAVDAVLLSRNTVHALVPAQWTRGRRAVYVAHARSTNVHATRATVRRTGYGPSGWTPIDGVDIDGVLGEFLDMRETSTDGFANGVRVTQPKVVPPVRMWLVAETMARRGTLGAHLPPTVQRERNFPIFAARSISLVPRAGSVQQGTRYTIVATALDAAGERVAGVPVRFSVEGTNPQPERVVLADDLGRAVYSYTPAKAGGDAIRAFADNELDGVAGADDPVNAAAVVVTTQARLMLTPGSTKPTPGTSLSVAAHVVDAAGAPLANVTVRFSVSGGTTASGSATTNGDGVAAFSYRGTVPSATDTITAFADMSNDGVAGPSDPTAEVEVTWDGLVPAAIALLPTSSSAPKGQVATFTATVTNAGGLRVPGVQVAFAVTGANTASATQTTDATGVASFSYTGGTSGTDTVKASVGGIATTVTHVVTIVIIAAQYVSVPNVVGMLLAAAENAIKASGLTVGTLTSGGGTFATFAAASIKAGGTPTVMVTVVTDQNPAAGMFVVKNSAVDLKTTREPFDGGSALTFEAR